MVQKAGQRVAGGLSQEPARRRRCSRLRARRDLRRRRAAAPPDPLGIRSSERAATRREPHSSRRTRIGTATPPGADAFAGFGSPRLICARRLGAVRACRTTRAGHDRYARPGPSSGIRVPVCRPPIRQEPTTSATPSTRKRTTAPSRPRRLQRPPSQPARRSPPAARISATATANSRRAACWSSRSRTRDSRSARGCRSRGCFSADAFDYSFTCTTYASPDGAGEGVPRRPCLSGEACAWARSRGHDVVPVRLERPNASATLPRGDPRRSRWGRGKAASMVA